MALSWQEVQSPQAGAAEVAAASPRPAPRAGQGLAGETREERQCCRSGAGPQTQGAACGEAQRCPAGTPEVIGMSATSDVKEPTLMVSGMQACSSELFPKQVDWGGPV